MRWSICSLARLLHGSQTLRVFRRLPRCAEGMCPQMPACFPIRNRSSASPYFATKRWYLSSTGASASLRVTLRFFGTASGSIGIASASFRFSTSSGHISGSRCSHWAESSRGRRLASSRSSGGSRCHVTTPQTGCRYRRRPSGPTPGSGGTGGGSHQFGQRNLKKARRAAKPLIRAAIAQVAVVFVVVLVLDVFSREIAPRVPERAIARFIGSRSPV